MAQTRIQLPGFPYDDPASVLPSRKDRGLAASTAQVADKAKQARFLLPGTASGNHLGAFLIAATVAVAGGISGLSPENAYFTDSFSNQQASSNPFPARPQAKVEFELPAEAVLAVQAPSLELVIKSPEMSKSAPKRDFRGAGSAGTEVDDWTGALAVAKTYSKDKQSPIQVPAREKEFDNILPPGRVTKTTLAKRRSAFGEQLRPVGLRTHKNRKIRARKVYAQLKAARFQTMKAVLGGSTEEEAAQKMTDAFTQKDFHGTKLDTGRVRGVRRGKSAVEVTRLVSLPITAEDHAPVIPAMGGIR